MHPYICTMHKWPAEMGGGEHPYFSLLTIKEKKSTYAMPPYLGPNLQYLKANLLWEQN